MILTAPCDRTRSTSDIGLEIRTTLSAVSAHWHRSFTFGEKWNVCINSLIDVVRECSQPGWDGYDAIAVSGQTAACALDFTRTIPNEFPLPEISATSGGEVTFEWALTARRLVTIAVGENGEVHYASLNGLKKNFGSYPLTGKFEPELRSLVESALG